MTFGDVKIMFEKRLPMLWDSWKLETPDKWRDPSCTSWRLLQFVAKDLKLIDGFVFELLRQTVASTQVPEIKLKCFNILTASMDHLSVGQHDAANLRSMLQVRNILILSFKNYITVLFLCFAGRPS